MKGIAVLVALGLLLPAGVAAQGRGQSAPQASVQAGTGTIGYTVDGIHVVHRVAANSDIIVANLYLLGGVRQVTTRNAGIELLLLEASGRGTRTYSRDQLRRRLASLGTSIQTRILPDWSSIGLQATRQTFDSTWKVMTSRLMEPLLEQADVELVRTQLVTGVRQRQDSPDALAEYVADSFAFDGHPYAIEPTGTEASLSSITLPDLRAYHTSQIVKSRLLLVIVGNVSQAHVTRLVRGSLASLPAGNYTWTLPDTLPRRRADALTIDRRLPTNYIVGRYPGPRADSPDYHALRIASAILSGQLFSEIRSRRNLTYAVDAPFVERAVSAGGLYVTTVSPDVTLRIMHMQLQDLQNGSIDPDGLERLILQFITQYFIDNESSEQQAHFLARAQLYYGDFRRADTFVDELRAITPEDIRRAARRYMRDVRFVYIGDARSAPLDVMRRY
jgi:zinc protease